MPFPNLKLIDSTMDYLENFVQDVLEGGNENQKNYLMKRLQKYPKILAKGSLDRGNLSKTLGSYKLRLKDNQTLPKHKKVFFLNPQDNAKVLYYSFQ